VRAVRVRLIAAVLILAAMAVMVASIVPLLDNTWARTGLWRAETLATSINRALSQCYALEGEYPPDLSYLVENYGIVLDEELFFYRYQYNGGNLRPEVWVVAR
jgi:hypothetical protein